MDESKVGRTDSGMLLCVRQESSMALISKASFVVDRVDRCAGGGASTFAAAVSSLVSSLVILSAKQRNAIK